MLKDRDGYNKASLWMGFFIALVMITTTALLTITEHYVFGLLSGGVAVTLIGLFVPKPENHKKSK